MWTSKDIAGVKKATSTALVNSELGTDSHATLCSEQQIRYYERLRYDRPPRRVRSIRNFLINKTPRVELGKKYDTRNGWSVLHEAATKRRWRAPRDWGKEKRKERLDRLARKWKAAETREAAKKGTAVTRYV